MTRFGRWSDVNGEETRYLKIVSIQVRAFCSRIVIASAQTLLSRFFYDAILRVSPK